MHRATDFPTRHQSGFWQIGHGAFLLTLSIELICYDLRLLRELVGRSKPDLHPRVVPSGCLLAERHLHEVVGLSQLGEHRPRLLNRARDVVLLRLDDLGGAEDYSLTPPELYSELDLHQLPFTTSLATFTHSIIPGANAAAAVR